MTTELQKPPLGLMPRKIHDRQRVDDIIAAMKRYAAVEKPAPVEWVEELEELFPACL